MTPSPEVEPGDREQAAVRHLLELGYFDPLDVSAERAAHRELLSRKLDQAQSLMASGEFVQAIDVLEAAAATDPNATAVRHLLARACFQSGRYAAAAEALRWLELNAVESAEFALMRSHIALDEGRLDDARDQAAYAQALNDPRVADLR